MIVRDLLALLEQQNPDASLVVWDPKRDTLLAWGVREVVGAVELVGGVTVTASRTVHPAVRIEVDWE